MSDVRCSARTRREIVSNAAVHHSRRRRAAHGTQHLARPIIPVMLKEGDPFPDFELFDQTGRKHTLDDLKGSQSVVYFYPKDDTPGCTAEACNFRDNLPKFHGVKV